MNLRDRLMALGRRWLATFGYVSFFLTCFSLFSYWVFPYGRLRDYLVDQINAGGAFQLHVGSLSPHWLTGLYFEDVTLTKNAEDADSEPVKVRVDEATARASLFSALTGRLSLDFWIASGDGSAEGTFEAEGQSMAVHATVASLNLRTLGIGELVGVPMRGTANGEVLLLLPEAVNESTGSIKLVIEQLQLGDGKTKVRIPNSTLREGFSLDRMDAGALNVAIEVSKGLATIKQMSADGPDVRLNVDGSVRLARPFMRSRGDLTIAVRFTDKYRQSSDRTKALFQLLDFQPELTRAKRDDGTLEFQVTGALNALRGAASTASDAGPAAPRRSARSKRRK